MKKDINLLPSRKRRVITLKSIISTLILVDLLGIGAYFAFKLPAKAIADAKTVESKLTSELLQYGDFNAHYDELMLNQENLTVEKIALEQSLDMSKNAIVIVRKLDGSRPNGITVDSITYSDLGIRISGIADKMNTVSEFMVNLRKTDLFGDSNISNLNSNEDDSYGFDLSLTYIVEEVEPIEEEDSIDEDE